MWAERRHSGRAGAVAYALAAGLWLWLAACGGVAAAAPAGGEAADEARLLGRWLTEKHEGTIGIIEITRAADGSYQGRIIGGNAPQKLDSHNPDPSRRQLLLRGQTILQGVHAESEGHWAGGTIYDPDSGHTYRARLELLDAEHLKVRGFIGISLFGRTQTWTRYQGSTLDLPPDAP